jgi:hypothetical protein
MMRGFEGGQMPLHRRLPKRGFTNIFRTEYTVVNLDRIAELDVKEIGLDDYKKLGLPRTRRRSSRVLGSGELTKAITIHAHKFSKSASRRSKRPAARLSCWALRLSPRRLKPRALCPGTARVLRDQPSESRFRIRGCSHVPAIHAIRRYNREDLQDGTEILGGIALKRISNMLEKFLNIFRIPDLRKRVLFTLGILAVYRLGAHIPTPGVNAHQLELLFSSQGGSAWA